MHGENSVLILTLTVATLEAVVSRVNSTRGLDDDKLQELSHCFFILFYFLKSSILINEFKWKILRKQPDARRTHTRVGDKSCLLFFYFLQDRS